MATYHCKRWPFLKISGVAAFDHGVFETDDPEVIAFMQGVDGYGIHILPAPPDEIAAPTPAPEPEPEPDAPSLEQPVAERWAGRVRQGRRGTN